MNNIRIIPRLDIKGPNLVKGIHLEGLRVLGKPKEFAKYYYEQGADELIYQDVVASLYNRNSLHEMISETVKDIFIPLTVAGGLRTIEDIKQVLRAGADKVSINTAAIQNPDFITKAAQKFGSSTIVVAIEAIKQPDGQYLAFTDNGREHTGVEVIGWAKRVEKLGAGEIIITSIDNEGTGKGYDLELVQKVSTAVSIPVIAHGGMGDLPHIKEVIDHKADAIALSSVLHYEFVEKLKEIEVNQVEGNFDFLKSKRRFSKIRTLQIPQIKDYLLDHNINCRN